MERIVAYVGNFLAASSSTAGILLSWFLLVTLVPASGQAHDVIVQRETNLLERPIGNSAIMLTLKSGVEVKLLENLPVDGYYHVFHKRGNGWVLSRDVLIRQEYERGDWRHWIDADEDGQKTRAEVLIAESRETVTFKDDSKRVSVKTGLWVDPYTGETFSKAEDLDVDHMVPLMNAHASGGWLWDWERRRKYANDLNFPEHLIAVSASENRSKGAKGPDEWKPPNQEYWCEYAMNWERIKRRWDLTMTDEERKAVEDMKRRCP